jgi:hypothetical protein
MISRLHRALAVDVQTIEDLVSRTTPEMLVWPEKVTLAARALPRHRRNQKGHRSVSYNSTPAGESVSGSCAIDRVLADRCVALFSKPCVNM